MKDPASATLSDICDAMYDITLCNSFEQISITDQKLFTDVYGRLKRRLNRAGIVTMEDHLNGALCADADAAVASGCSSVGATIEERDARARQFAAENAGE